MAWWDDITNPRNVFREAAHSIHFYQGLPDNELAAADRFVDSQLSELRKQRIALENNLFLSTRIQGSIKDILEEKEHFLKVHIAITKVRENLIKAEEAAIQEKEAEENPALNPETYREASIHELVKTLLHLENRAPATQQKENLTPREIVANKIRYVIFGALLDKEEVCDPASYHDLNVDELKKFLEILSKQQNLYQNKGENVLKQQIKEVSTVVSAVTPALGEVDKRLKLAAEKTGITVHALCDELEGIVRHNTILPEDKGPLWVNSISEFHLRTLEERANANALQHYPPLKEYGGRSVVEVLQELAWQDNHQNPPMYYGLANDPKVKSGKTDLFKPTTCKVSKGTAYFRDGTLKPQSKKGYPVVGFTVYPNEEIHANALMSLFVTVREEQQLRIEGAANHFVQENKETLTDAALRKVAADAIASRLLHDAATAVGNTWQGWNQSGIYIDPVQGREAISVLKQSANTLVLNENRETLVGYMEGKEEGRALEQKVGRQLAEVIPFLSVKRNIEHQARLDIDITGLKVKYVLKLDQEIKEINKTLRETLKDAKGTGKKAADESISKKDALKILDGRHKTNFRTHRCHEKALKHDVTARLKTEGAKSGVIRHWQDHITAGDVAKTLAHIDDPTSNSLHRR